MRLRDRNVFMAVIFIALWWIAPATYFFTETFVLANIFTALTNFLPVFPLDGGRVLLAVMSRRLPRQKAYKCVRLFGFAICGMFCALFALSFFHGANFTFALMALFVLLSTIFPDKNSKYQRLYSMAYRSEKIKHGLTVREVMVSDSASLYSLEKMLNGNYYYRFIVVNDRLEQICVITETRLEELLAKLPSDTVLSQLQLGNSIDARKLQ